MGIDCGETTLHAAFASGTAKPVVLRSPPDRLSVVCDVTAPGTALGVSFPGALNLLGSGKAIATTGDRNLTAEDVFAAKFRALRQALPSGVTPDRTIVAVPDTFTTSRRQALLETLALAGVPQPRLVDRTLAFAAGHVSTPGVRRTLLIVLSDYGSTQIAVVRGGDDRYRTLATTTVDCFGDQHNIAHLLEESVRQLRERGIYLGLKTMTAEQWAGFRSRLVAAWPALASGTDVRVSYPREVTRQDSIVETQHSHKSLRARLQPLIQRVLDAASSAVDEAGISVVDVDQLLLAGLDTGVRLLAAPLQAALPVTQALASGELAAIGATYLARSLPPATVATASAVSPAAETNEGVRSIGDLTLNNLRKQWADGQRQQALVQLGALVTEAEQLHQNWRATDTPDKPVASEDSAVEAAHASIARANRELLNNRLDEAVAWAHQAQHSAPDDPDVFAAMIKIHHDAAARMVEPEDYPRAIQTLACAFAHDQTDRRIRHALARRHYDHGCRMIQLGNHALALDCLRQASQHDPRSEDIRAMLNRVGEALRADT